MTPLQNQAITTLPNVIRDQTMPNTLGGVSDPSPFLPRRAPSVASAVVAAGLVATVIAAVLAIGGRFA
ncbi:MAG TPA: hypothetical protein VIZ22_10540 [Candidatus Limnocylindrales bacterium]|jgi:hypothetical protein